MTKDRRQRAEDRGQKHDDRSVEYSKKLTTPVKLAAHLTGQADRHGTSREKLGMDSFLTNSYWDTDKHR